ncbi:MAG: DUF1565 domain-containing protein [Candidatus Coatesbacteria bacterium]|nr:DUF1565 domain-containing protein [Candidatus Coatesbacteria bacterium]
MRAAVRDLMVVVALILTLSPCMGDAGLMICVTTDSKTYSSGDTVKVGLSIDNSGRGESVDVYMGLFTWDNHLYTIHTSGWSEEILPWASGFFTPSGCRMDCTPFPPIDLPCETPPIGHEGQYAFAALLTHSGSLDWASLVALAPFSVGEEPGSHLFVDGESGDDSNDGSDTTPFKTITHALASAQGSQDDPVTIHVGEGLYSHASNEEQFPLNMRSYVSIVGQGAADTVIDAKMHAYHVFYCEGVYESSIEAVAITGGSANGSSGLDRDHLGGGIYCFSGSLKVLNCVISGNSAGELGTWGNGSGMYFEQSTVLISDSKISGNYLGGIECYGCSVIIYNNVVAGNMADGMDCVSGSAIILNNLVADNSMSGIYCALCSPIIVNNTILRNKGSQDSTGIDCHDCSETILNCIIWDNDDDLSDCSASYCCVQDDDWGIGNIHDYPDFVTGALGDYYLNPQSSCIDAGKFTANDLYLERRTTQTDGAKDTGNADIGFHYRMPTGSRAPVASIASIFPNPVRQGRDNITFRGAVTDDGEIIAYEWASSLDGLLSTHKTFSIPHAVGLTVGTHTISFRAEDDEGQWSEPATQELTVLPSQRYEVFVDARVGDDYNSGTQDSPFETITHALAVIQGSEGTPGTVHVGPGTYSKDSNGEALPLKMKSWVSLLGDGADNTILLGGYSDVIECVGVSYSTIEGFTLANGGCGVFCQKSSPVITNNTITSNLCGGVYCLNSSPTISDNGISGNFSNAGGAGVFCCDSSPMISDNTIVSNETGFDRNGGGILCEGGAPVIDGNLIADNHSEQDGGGIYCIESSPIISSNTITGNVTWASYSSFDPCGNGGGLCCAKSSPEISNNIISQNGAVSWSGPEGGNGGGIYCDADSSPRVSNNTIVGNEADYIGGGIYGADGSWPIIIDCIIWGNGDDLFNCGGTYCCIEDGDEGEGNIHSNPMFVPGPLGDYYLHPDSSCVDAGSRTADEAGLAGRTTQTDWKPDTGRVDIGFHYPLPSPIGPAGILWP